MLEIKSSNLLITNQIDSTVAGESMRSLLMSVSVVALMVPLSVDAAETVAYSYDARGRLIKVIRSGSAQSNSNVTTDYTHDKANNRKQFVTINSPNSPGTPPPPPSPPPPPPPSSNQPPVANPDNAGSMQVCKTKNVVVTANDTDPEGNLPLSVIAASGNGAMEASVVNGTTIQLISSSVTGSQSANYTVRDSLGASSTGTVTVNVSGGICQ